MYRPSNNLSVDGRMQYIYYRIALVGVTPPLDAYSLSTRIALCETVTLGGRSLTAGGRDYSIARFSDLIKPYIYYT